MENLPAVGVGGERSTIGLRYDLNDHSATKLEYDHHRSAAKGFQHPGSAVLLRFLSG